MTEHCFSLDDSILIDESVVFRGLSEDTVILNLETGEFLGLDEVGTRIWTLMREKSALRTVLGILLTEYDAAPETLQTDLLRLVEQLSAKGLVEIKKTA